MRKKLIKVMLLTFFAFCLNSNAVLAESNTDKPEDTILNTTGKKLSDFIPKDWKIISKVQGDLNKDKRVDIAAVIEYTGEYNASDEEEMSGKPRILFVVFKNKAGTYKLSVQSSTIILRAGQGGVFGDPFVGIEYSRGSIVVSSYGGSSWRWGYTYRFRYQNKGWYLIGETTQTHNTHTGETEIIDTNCLTGKQIITKSDITGNEKNVTQNIGKKKLKNLLDF